MNAVIDTGAQESVVRANVIEGKSVDYGGIIQITSAFREPEMGELKVFDMEINNPRHGVVPISKKLANDMLISSSDYERLIESSQLVRNLATLKYLQRKKKLLIQ
ncbi:hypothetical protein TNIN_279471 [Trichonephila inaurata madagascariensis]|uniref:Uncharacterized protein n=1 Tax=Trichonephila inaurata madagascariensis TaxID=2747483 RepID=A0A8X6WYY8_9ARAC|nr:hypothetical protein TNIN_279471 [Trichonephila inaurata madagascariensis]